MAENFELGEQRSLQDRDRDDDRSSLHSSCGSLSFVITDDADIDTIREPDADNNMISYMTQSQYAQVVFQDIADRYPNNQDLECKFTLTGQLMSAENDRIGFYRVPSFAPHDYIAFKWVTSDMLVDHKDKTYVIVFEGMVLPKDEDFYQFQYLRSDQVFGASVPFQLRGGQDLYTVEDDEFMRVDREADVAHRSMVDKLGLLAMENENIKTQLNEWESKIKDLTTQNEELKEELKTKNESFNVLEGQYKSHQESSSKEVEQFKMDFAFALQDKLLLEERLHKGQKGIKELQTDRDTLSGQARQLQREKLLMEEEILSMSRKMEEEKNMLMATAKAKEMAVAELKLHIVKNDELQKKVARLQRDLEQTCDQNDNLKMVLDSLKLKFEHLELSKERNEIEKDLVIADLEAKLEHVAFEKDTEILRLQNEVSLKQREFEILSSELIAKSKSKFQQIDQLKKQLSDAERNLNKYINGPVSNSGPTSVASVLESLSQLEINDERESFNAPLRTLESRIHALHSEFKMVEQNHSEEIRSIRDELESLRSNPMTQSYSSSISSNDSRRMMESQVIYRAMTSQTEEEDVTSQEEASQATPVPSAPVVAPPLPPPRTQPVVLAPARFQLPSSSSGSPPKSEAAEEGPDSGSHWFLSVTPVLASHQEKKKQAPESSLPAPLVPQKVGSQPESLTETEDDELSALNMWARGTFTPTQSETDNVSSLWASQTSRASSHTSSQVEPEVPAPSHQNQNHGGAAAIVEIEPETEILITDDGRTMEAPKSNLICPFCQKEYLLHEVERLELHVETHMERMLTCPICDANYEIRNEDRTEYQAHVQSHFPDETSFVEVQHPSAEQQQQQQQQQQEPRDRFWFLDFD